MLDSNTLWIVFVVGICMYLIRNRKDSSSPPPPPTPPSSPASKLSSHTLAVNLLDDVFMNLGKAISDTEKETVNPDKMQYLVSDYKSIWNSEYARYGSPENQIAAWKKDVKDNYERYYVPLYGPIQRATDGN